MGAVVGLWKRRREQLDDLRHAAITAAAQLKAAQWLGRPQFNDGLLLTAEEAQDVVSEAA